MVTNVVKRTGHTEPYVEQKLHDSIQAAVLGVRSFEGEASLLAARVCRDVWEWCEGKLEITSRDIHMHALASLDQLHPEAAFAYTIHDAVL